MMQHNCCAPSPLFLWLWLSLHSFLAQFDGWSWPVLCQQQQQWAADGQWLQPSRATCALSSAVVKHIKLWCMAVVPAQSSSLAAGLQQLMSAM
jgi:hypothetical protein